MSDPICINIDMPGQVPLKMEFNKKCKNTIKRTKLGLRGRYELAEINYKFVKKLLNLPLAKQKLVMIRLTDAALAKLAAYIRAKYLSKKDKHELYKLIRLYEKPEKRILVDARNLIISKTISNKYTIHSKAEWGDGYLYLANKFIISGMDIGLIMDCLKHPDTEVKKRAIYALGKLKDRAAVPYLINILKIETDSDLYGHAALALGKIGNKSALPYIVGLFKNKKRMHNYELDDLRDKVVFALIKLGGKKMIPHIMNAYRNCKESDAKGGLIIALAKSIAPGAELSDEGILLCGGSVKKIEDKETIKLFQQLFRAEKDNDVRGDLVYALGLTYNKLVAADLIRALKTDKQGKVRGWAATALGMICDHNTIPALIDSLNKDLNQDTRSEIARALGAFRDESAFPHLVKAFFNKSKPIDRSDVIEALLEVNRKKAMLFLNNVLTGKGHSDLKQDIRDYFEARKED